MKNPKLPILVGPTGVGKSEIAFLLAQRLGAEVISADAFQVYRGLEVGTAQPSKQMRAQVPHHLVGIRDPQESWSAVQFAREASRILENTKPFLLVGGAGFYIRALVEGPPSGDSSTPEVREFVAEKAEELGNEGAWNWLKERDPQAAQRLHANDQKRVLRALEKTFPPAPKPSADYEPLGEGRVLFLGLERSRDKLDVRLKERTEGMWSGGLLEETRALLGLGLPVDHPVWGAIGYAEAAAHLRGELKKEDALERIFRRTRQYAKRQWTWFRHQHDVLWFDLDRFTDPRSVLDPLEKAITP
jgi:tRNA dimethylallyltransferase